MTPEEKAAILEEATQIEDHADTILKYSYSYRSIEENVGYLQLVIKRLRNLANSTPGASATGKGDGEYGYIQPPATYPHGQQPDQRANL